MNKKRIKIVHLVDLGTINESNNLNKFVNQRSKIFGYVKQQKSKISKKAQDFLQPSVNKLNGINFYSKEVIL
jgi:hypothetical protein